MSGPVSWEPGRTGLSVWREVTEWTCHQSDQTVRVMLVTSYSPGDRLHTGLCTSSSVSESRQMITIQTSVQETFREASQEAASEDVFSQHFETDIQKLETQTRPHTSETDKSVQSTELPQSPASTARYNLPKPKEKLETRLVELYTICKPCGFPNRLNKSRNQFSIWGQMIMGYFLSSRLDHCQQQNLN